MPFDPKAFDDLRPETHAVIESLLTDLHAAGDWYDDHEDMLDAWRAARGEDAKDRWCWWWKLPDDLLFRSESTSREDALAEAWREEPNAKEIVLVEARLWNDRVKEGEEECAFAETRGSQTVQRATNDA